jgi:GT2 family glycosyltransferase
MMREGGTARAGATAVLIVACGHDGDTLLCLASLANLRVRPGWIVLADNGGEGGMPLLRAWRDLWRKKKLPDPVMADSAGEDDAFVYLPLPENRGFAAGVNAAFSRVRGRARYLWLLNPDTEAEPCALEALLDALEGDPGVSAAGSTLLLPAEPSRVLAAAGGRIHPLWGTTSHLLAGEAAERAGGCDEGCVNRRLDFVSGASLLARAEAMERAGLLDEDFFLYYEDAEWCVRLRRAGRRLAWAKGSRVRHGEGGSTGARGRLRPAWVDYLMLRNRILLLRRHYPASLPLAALSYAAVALRRVARGQTRRVPLVWRALRDGLLGKGGRPDREALAWYE